MIFSQTSHVPGEHAQFGVAPVTRRWFLSQTFVIRVCMGHRRTASLSGGNTQKNVIEIVTRCPSRGCGTRRTQARHVSNDDLMECF